MYEPQKPLSISSAASATIVTAVVLLIAASANAQDGSNLVPPTAPEPDIATSSPVNPDNGRVPPQVPPPTPPPTNMPVIDTPTPPPAPVEGMRPVSTMGNPNASGTPSFNSRLELLKERQTLIENRRANIEEKRQALQTASSTRRGVLSQNLQNLAVGGLNRVSSLLSNAITKMKDGGVRLRNHATTLQGEGQDMSAVFPLLDEVDSILNLANNSLTGIDVNTRFAVTSTSPKEDWQAVRDQFSETRSLLNEAKETLRQAIAAIKHVGTTTVEVSAGSASVTQ